MQLAVQERVGLPDEMRRLRLSGEQAPAGMLNGALVKTSLVAVPATVMMLVLVPVRLALSVAVTV